MKTHLTLDDRNRQRVDDARSRAKAAAQTPGSGASGRSRNEMIYFMQTLGAILVVLLHVPHLGVEGYDSVMGMFAFRMPMFMFISGYLMKYGFGSASCGQMGGG